MDFDNKINKATNAGIKYLALKQGKNKGFVSNSSPSLINFMPLIEYQTTFVPALILTCLSNINIPETNNIKDNLVEFLYNQKSP